MESDDDTDFFEKRAGCTARSSLTEGDAEQEKTRKETERVRVLMDNGNYNDTEGETRSARRRGDEREIERI